MNKYSSTLTSNYSNVQLVSTEEHVHLPRFVDKVSQVALCIKTVEILCNNGCSMTTEAFALWSNIKCYIDPFIMRINITNVSEKMITSFTLFCAISWSSWFAACSSMCRRRKIWTFWNFKISSRRTRLRQLKASFWWIFTISTLCFI